MGPAACAGHPHWSPGEGRAPQEGAAHGRVGGWLGRRARLRAPDFWTKAAQQAVVGGRGAGGSAAQYRHPLVSNHKPAEAFQDSHFSSS